MKRHIPNFLTSCNLACGTLGILYLFTGDGVYPIALFVWLAALFDFFDGFVARLLHVKSAIGKELDSLADMVSFGLLPALFLYHLIYTQGAHAFALPALLIAIFSALRLAKFNIDETQTDSFRGLPTPANAIFVTGLPFLESSHAAILLHPLTLSAIGVIFSLLLVANFELFALKFKDFSWASNKVRFTFLGLSVLLLVSFKFAAIPLIIISYILISLGVWMVNRARK